MELRMSFFRTLKSMFGGVFHQDVYVVYGFETWEETFAAACRDVGGGPLNSYVSDVLGELEVLAVLPGGEEELGRALKVLCTDVDIAYESTPSVEVRNLLAGIGGAFAEQLAADDAVERFFADPRDVFASAIGRSATDRSAIAERARRFGEDATPDQVRDVLGWLSAVSLLPGGDAAIAATLGSLPSDADLLGGRPAGEVVQELIHEIASAFARRLASGEIE